MSTGSETPKQAIKEFKILILGDVHLDTLVIPVSRKWNSGKGNWWRLRRCGGAWLLEEIMRAAIDEIHAEALTKGYEIKVESYDRDSNGVARLTIQSSLDKQYQSSAAILGLFPKRMKSNQENLDKVYRVERLLGWIHNDKDGDGYQDSFEKCLQPYVMEGTDERNILVIHDKARDFRYLPHARLERILERHFVNNKTWIIWQMDSPLTKDEPITNKENQLWRIISKNAEYLKRTIVIVKGECLRQAGANLPDSVSLEGESENFIESMNTASENSVLKDLARVGHLVVHFPRQGVLYANEKGELKNSCYYCPNINDQSNSRELGTMIGYRSILVATVARGVAWSSIVEDLEVSEGIVDGIKHGVILDHLHYLQGYGDRDSIEKTDDPKPYKDLFQAFSALAHRNKWKEGLEDYRLAALPLPPLSKGKLPSNWSRITGFIERKFRQSNASVTTDVGTEEAKKMAETSETEFAAHVEKTMLDIVCRGLEKVIEEEAAATRQNRLPGTPGETILCPFETHGKIKTAYRKEIESFASIQRIIRRYLNDETWTSPLSIAVFGPPGAGKSFTIRQILGSVREDIAKRPLEYNVAQFTDTKDLETAFRKVQDEAVAGEVPLVFFDEFDSYFGRNKLGWLKYFLAPMQDGTFKAGESTYRIGRAIFVFAGGIYNTWDDFYEKHKEGNRKDTEEINGKSAYEEFKDSKGTDFVSRLRGYLDIAPINCTNGDKVDLILMFRRAVLLRSLLNDHFKEIIDNNTQEARIDSDLLRAFLTVPHYEHESRSMLAIIEMSQASLRGRFQKSSLPAREQLNMHVDADVFFNHMDRGQFQVHCEPLTPMLEPEKRSAAEEDAKLDESLYQTVLTQPDLAIEKKAPIEVKNAPKPTNPEELGR